MPTDTLTPGTTTYSVPTGYTITKIRIWGGGGGGGPGSQGPSGLSGGGGGAGGYAELLNPGITTFTCGIGTGATETPAGSAATGHSGNQTTIPSLGLTANGGDGGGGGAGTRAGGTGGTAAGGAVNTTGSTGQNAPTTLTGGGGGANTAAGSGGGGSGGANLSNGTPGTAPGGGGGGGGHASPALGGGVGATGGNGQILVDRALLDIFILTADTLVYTITVLDTTRRRTVTRTADPPVYGLTDEPSTPTKTLHLIPTGPTLYTTTPTPTLRAHTSIRTAEAVAYSTSPAPTTRLITRNLTANPATYSTTPTPTTRQKTSTRSAQLCKYRFTPRPTAPHLSRKGVRRTLPRPDADNWRSLLLFTGISVTGDIGPITTYTTAAGKKVFFAKYELDGKIRTPARVACRNRWRAAAAEWQKLTPPERANWEAVTKKMSLRLTGYNLWLWWATHQDDASINTVARQAGIPLLPPSTRA